MKIVSYIFLKICLFAVSPVFLSLIVGYSKNKNELSIQFTNQNAEKLKPCSTLLHSQTSGARKNPSVHWKTKKLRRYRQGNSIKIIAIALLQQFEQMILCLDGLLSEDTAGSNVIETFTDVENKLNNSRDSYRKSFKGLARQTTHSAIHAPASSTITPTNLTTHYPDQPIFC